MAQVVCSRCNNSSYLMFVYICFSSSLFGSAERGVSVADDFDDLPEPLTDKQREQDRTSVLYVRNLLKMKGNKYIDVFCSRSKDGCKTTDGFPSKHTHSILKYDAVAKELETIPKRETGGVIRRLGDLGYFIFNDLLWSKDWKTFPIGADLEDHRKQRPNADLLMGKDSKAWSQKMIREHVRQFFEGRNVLDVIEDISIWINQLLHKILLDIDLTEDQAKEFEAYKGGSLKAALLPRGIVKTLKRLFKLDQLRSQRDAWIQKYEDAMQRDTRGILPEQTGHDRRFLADLLLTSITSAGGLSTPTVISICLGIFFGGENSPCQPSDGCKVTDTNIEAFVLEAIRAYPVVVGFPYWSPDIKNRTVLNLAMANKDTEEWGDDAASFRIRPLSEYHHPVGSGQRIGVAWAQQGVGPDGVTADSRGCPGQSMSITIVVEFIKQIRKMQHWVVTTAPAGGIKVEEGPSRASAFRLSLERGCNSRSADDDNTCLAPQFKQFDCPRECMYCCAGSAMGRKFSRRFGCVMPENTTDYEVNGYQCTSAWLMKNYDMYAYANGQSCSFTKAQRKAKVHNMLPRCPRHGYKESYASFVGYKRRKRLRTKKDLCSVTHTGSMMKLGVIGTYIDLNYMEAGSVCKLKAKEFSEDHRMQKNGTARLCEQLKEDLKHGRMDTFSMALWATALGAPQYEASIPKPRTRRQWLKKVRIPGWPARMFAIKTTKEDRQPDQAEGPARCFFKKIRALPFKDHLDDPGRNEYNESVRGPRDMQARYFGQFGLYQAPLHFDVPENQLQSDGTLEKLVFESIGAHRVELVQDGQLVSLNPAGVDPKLTASIPGSPGPLAALPEAVQKKIGFVVRLEGLFEDVPLRPGMARWGSNAFFDHNGKLTAIQRSGQTVLADANDKSWNYLKFVFRSSLISTATAFDHLVTTHIMAAETLALATVETLPPWHGLRKLLSPHTWGSIRVNVGAAVNLFAKNMLVHRAAPYTSQAFEPDDGSTGDLWKKTEILRYSPFPKVLEKYRAYRKVRLEACAVKATAEDENSSGLATNPGCTVPELFFFEDGELLYTTWQKYVSNFVRGLYGSKHETCDQGLQGDIWTQRFIARFFELSDPATPDFWPLEFRGSGRKCDDFVALITEMIFMVTGWHRHVGTVPDFFKDTSFVATSWKEGESRGRPKHTVMMQLLAATTDAKFPKLIQSLSDIYDDANDFKDNFRDLHEDMLSTQVTITARNKRRQAANHLPFHQMEPQYVDWGVQV